MTPEKKTNFAFTAAPSLIKRAKQCSRSKYGRRGFSKWVAEVIEAVVKLGTPVNK